MIRHFKGKTAFITGGAGGIGLGMAIALGERGVRLALADISAPELEQAEARLRKAGHAVLTFPLDVSDRKALQHAAEATAKAFGTISLVCANAGVGGHMGIMHEGSEQDWDWIIDVNVKGSINTVEACLPYLLGSGEEGHIVLTSSISGLRIHRPSRGQGMYNTTKFALMGYGEALNVDLAGTAIGVSILCPGFVNTDLPNSGRNRPGRYGGAFSIPEDDVMAGHSRTGTDPVVFGRWVVRAIEAGQLFVITHPQDRQQVADRHEALMHAFDASADLTRG